MLYSIDIEKIWVPSQREKDLQSTRTIILDEGCKNSSQLSQWCIVVYVGLKNFGLGILSMNI
jgi:hypothetical protein